jgi:type VI secretion system protein ImpH
MTARNDLLGGAIAFDFFEACRRLETENPSRPKIGDSAARREDYARFGQDPYFAFPATNVVRARDMDGGAAVQLMVAFLGMLGPQGALPLATTEEADRYVRENDDALPRFLDLFNHRFVQLFFRAWADSRPIVHRDRPREDDRFDAYLGAPIGLGAPEYRGLDSIDDRVKTAFSGLLAPKVKSASRLRALLSSLFGARVEIVEFVGVRLLFEPEQRSRIGQGFSTLGKDLLVGSGVFSVQDKIRVRIYCRSFAQYRELLPDGAKAGQLADVIAFYLGAEMEWDIELALPIGEAQPARLGSSGQLGWTGWLAPPWTSKEGYRTDARFDLGKRFPRARKVKTSGGAKPPVPQRSKPRADAGEQRGLAHA